MNGSRLFLDTNIVIYLLQGDETLASFLNHNRLSISFITQLELLSYSKLSKKDIKKIESFLDECEIVELNEEIKELTIQLRREKKLKLPDSIIAATAFYKDMSLVTADTQFGSISDLHCVIYEQD